jgi:hypothetical protein
MDGKDKRLPYSAEISRYPVGIVGYPSLLENWALQNPAVLGPALYDHPMLAPRLMDDKRFAYYLVSCDWMYNLFHPFYGDKLAKWYAGIDLDEWPDTSKETKDIDFLIYDKIRWDRAQLAADFLQPVETELKRHGFRTALLRYKYYDYQTYRRMLKRSRAMVFICEHETQGMAYQEALASSVPILAWDNGFWLDPLWKRFSDSMVPASSVPYFSQKCGYRFSDARSFEDSLMKFVADLPKFRPREFVDEQISMRGSADIYAKLYFSLMDPTSNPLMH